MWPPNTQVIFSGLASAGLVIDSHSLKQYTQHRAAVLKIQDEQDKIREQEAAMDIVGDGPGANTDARSGTASLLDYHIAIFLFYSPRWQ